MLQTWAGTVERLEREHDEDNDEKHKDDDDYLTWWPTTHIGVVICAWQMTFAAIEEEGLVLLE